MAEFVKSGSPWEDVVSYARACKMGNTIAVSGTTSIQNGKVFAPFDPQKQTQQALLIIEEALQKFGATKNNIIRTRIFVTHVDDWEKIAAAHRSFFQGHTPACTMVEVSRLIDPELVVEIEADAVMV